MRMTLDQKVREVTKQGIHLPDNLFKEKIVGVYGFFAIRGGEKSGEATSECFYIGKSTDIASRLFNSENGGHLHDYLNKRLNKLVPKEIDRYRKLGFEIEVRILCNFNKDYKDTHFSRAAHRLALAELQEIVRYQALGQCLKQRPEGAGNNEKAYWEKNYQTY